VNSVSQCGHLCFFVVVVEGDFDMRPGVSGAGKLILR